MTPLPPSHPSYALKDFERWARDLIDPEMAAFARDCANTLRKQGVDAQPPQRKKAKWESKLGKSETGFKGVHIIKRADRKYVYYDASIRVNGYNKRKSFKCPIQAAKQFDVWCWELHHDPLRLNFPEDYK